MLAPILCMAGWHTQIERRTVCRRIVADTRLAIDDRRRRITANVDLAIKTRLADGDGDLGNSGGGGRQQHGLFGHAHRAEFSRDGVHLNPKGYAAWAEALRPVVDGDRSRADR